MNSQMRPWDFQQAYLSCATSSHEASPRSPAKSSKTQSQTPSLLQALWGWHGLDELAAELATELAGASGWSSLAL
jgi:hypothetical protein